MGRRIVVISEPHPYRTVGKYGGHQYAKVFARNGWQVILLSATFNWLRLLLPRPGVDSGHLELWRSGGQTVAPNILNVSLAHPLPACMRTARPIRWLASKLFLPSPAALLRKVGATRADLLWLNGNEDWLLRQAVPHDRLVIRIIDNYAGFGAGYRNFHPMMLDVLAAADGVFACSHYVRDLYSGFRDDISVIPNGVDWEHFSQSNPVESPILQEIPRPRAVYIGAVAAWFDWDLMFALAKRFTGVNFVIIGTLSRESPLPESFPPNLHLLGPVTYDAVPAILARCDVGLVPFKLSDLVQGVSPIKVYEYLAAGLPVVALRWRGLEFENLPITLATGEMEFAEGLEKALNATESERAALRTYAHDCTWEQRLTKLLKTVGVNLANG